MKVLAGSWVSQHYRRVRALILCFAAALCSGCATVSHLRMVEVTADPHNVPMIDLAGETGQSDAASLSAVPPHPDLLPRGEGIPLSRLWAIHASEAQSTAGPALNRDWHVDTQPRLALMDFSANTQLTLAPDSSADATAATSPPELNPFSKAYAGVVWEDIKATFTAPAHWDTCDWLVAGGVAAGIGTVAVFDEDIQRAVQRNRNGTLDDIFSNVQGFGNEYAPGVIGAFYLGGVVFLTMRQKPWP